MKFMLMIQSLSPLALLTIIRNFCFVTTDKNGVALSFCDFVQANWTSLIILSLCLCWLLGATICFLIFGAFRYTDKKTGFTVKNVTEQEDAGLNFFMTLVLPLLIDDIASIQGALSFLVIVIMILILLSKTNLFYANPILSILGYRIYEFHFDNNSDFSDEIIIGIAHGKIQDHQCIEYKKINEKVLYVKGMKS